MVDRLVDRLTLMVDRLKSRSTNPILADPAESVVAEWVGGSVGPPPRVGVEKFWVGGSSRVGGWGSAGTSPPWGG